MGGVYTHSARLVLGMLGFVPQPNLQDCTTRLHKLKVCATKKWIARPQREGSVRAGRPRPYDLSFVDGLRGLCVVGIVFCLNQDFQDWERSIHIPHRWGLECWVSFLNPTYKIAQTESLCYKEADSTPSVEVLVGRGETVFTEENMW